MNNGLRRSYEKQDSNLLHHIEFFKSSHSDLEVMLKCQVMHANSRTLLHIACAEKNVELAEYVIKCHKQFEFDMCARDAMGKTPLTLVLEYPRTWESYKIAQLLDYKGCSLESQDPEQVKNACNSTIGDPRDFTGRTPLVIGLTKKFPNDVINTLISNGANTNQVVPCGLFPHEYALKNYPENVELYTLLTAARNRVIRINASTHSPSNRTEPAKKDMFMYMNAMSYQAKLVLSRDLPTYVAEFGLVPRYGIKQRTPLHYAAMSGNVDALDEFALYYDRATNVDLPDADGKTPLALASQGPEMTRANVVSKLITIFHCNPFITDVPQGNASIPILEQRSLYGTESRFLGKLESMRTQPPAHGVR